MTPDADPSPEIIPASDAMPPTPAAGDSSTPAPPASTPLEDIVTVLDGLCDGKPLPTRVEQALQRLHAHLGA